MHPLTSHVAEITMRKVQMKLYIAPHLGKFYLYYFTILTSLLNSHNTVMGPQQAGFSDI